MNIEEIMEDMKKREQSRIKRIQLQVNMGCSNCSQFDEYFGCTKCDQDYFNQKFKQNFSAG